MKKKHVIINGGVFLYQDKAPFVPSGKSIAGAIEYDQDNDLLKCHECGEHKPMLGRHIFTDHGMTSAQYKRKHQLNQSTALVRESVRVKLSSAAKRRVETHKLPPMWNNPTLMAKAREKAVKNRRKLKHISAVERRNAQMHCKAQLMEKLKNIAISLKRTPSRKDLKENGIPSGSLEYHFGSLAKAMSLAGLQPNKNIGMKNYRRYSDEYLLRSIRIFIANFGRVPYASDFRRGLLGASRALYRQRFGSLNRANRLAMRKK